MAKTLIPIPNQPLRFTDYNEAKFCKKTEPYCYLHQPDDPIRVQFKQKPCGDNLLCNPDFANSDELVTNGDFDGNMDGWTNDGHGVWSYGSGKVTADGSGAGFWFEQALATTAGNIYKVQFTISGRTKGSVGVRLGSAATFIYTSINGTITLYLTDTSDHVLRFITGGSSPNFFDGSIDDVSVTFVECWSESADPRSWDITDGKACHIAGLSTTLTNTGTTFTQGKYYKVIWKITGRTAGSAEVQICGNSFAVRSSNGTFTEYIVGGTTGTSLAIIPSTDFDGCIEAIEVYELKKDFVFSLIDMDGNIMADLSYLAEYENEYVSLQIDGLNNLIIDAFPFPIPIPVLYGCYRILVEDQCAEYYSAYCGEASEYISNCIKYGESFAGTYLVIGNNNPSRGVKKWAFGFYFSRNFYLVQRLYIGFRKPKNPDKFDRGRYSSGVHYKSFVELDKVWELVFGAVTEIEHDAINVQINCKEFGFIKNGCEYQYFNITEEYAPEWDAKGYLERVESRIEVMAIGDTLTSSQMPSVDDFLLTEDEQALQLEQGGNLDH